MRYAVHGFGFEFQPKSPERTIFELEDTNKIEARKAEAEKAEKIRIDNLKIEFQKNLNGLGYSAESAAVKKLFKSDTDFEFAKLLSFDTDFELAKKNLLKIVTMELTDARASLKSDKKSELTREQKKEMGSILSLIETELVGNGEENKGSVGMLAPNSDRKIEQEFFVGAALATIGTAKRAKDVIEGQQNIPYSKKIKMLTTCAIIGGVLGAVIGGALGLVLGAAAGTALGVLCGLAVGAILYGCTANSSDKLEAGFEKIRSPFAGVTAKELRGKGIFGDSIWRSNDANTDSFVISAVFKF